MKIQADQTTLKLHWGKIHTCNGTLSYWHSLLSLLWWAGLTTTATRQAPPLGVWEVFKWSVGNVVFREAQKAGECLW